METLDTPKFGMKYPSLTCHKCGSDWLMCVEPGTDGDDDGTPLRGWCYDCAPFLQGMQFNLFEPAKKDVDDLSKMTYVLGHE